MQIGDTARCIWPNMQWEIFLKKPKESKSDETPADSDF